MNWQKITEMPCVIQIVRTAEKEIKELVGKEVSLVVAEVNLKKDDRKQILQDTVCAYCNVSWKDIVSKSRKDEIVEARHIYMYLAAQFCSHKEVGEDCHRDRSSVTSAVLKIDGYYKMKDDFITRVEAVKNLLPKQILQ